MGEIPVSNNIEIDKALKEFEANSAGSQNSQSSNNIITPKKQVEGVSFENDTYGAEKFYKETDAPKIVKLFMSSSGGVIKSQKTAEYILFVLVILSIIFSVFLIFSSGKKAPKPNSLFLEQAQRMQQLQKNN